MISDRIREARIESGLSQADLARLLNRRHGWAKCSQTTIWAVETGNRHIRLSEAAAMSVVLNVSLDRIARGAL